MGPKKDVQINIALLVQLKISHQKIKKVLHLNSQLKFSAYVKYSLKEAKHNCNAYPPPVLLS